MRLAIKLILIGILVASCGGKDNDNPTPPEETEKELGTFTLTFPDNNLICTEGEDNATDQVGIEFQWSASTNATSYELAITNQENNTVDKRTVNETSLVVGLPRGTQFSWEVTAKVDTKTLTSNSWNFYSEGIGSESYAPFPAEITVTNDGNSFVSISWTAEDLDDDLTSYDVYLGTTDNPILVLENTTVLSTNYNIIVGTAYIVKVVSKDSRNNSSTSELAFSY